MLVDHVTIRDDAGADATLWSLLVVVILAGVIVLPALGYLFALTQSERWVVEARTVTPAPRPWGDEPGRQ